MSALRDQIIGMIQQEGPISVERYMALALAHPTHGYYMRGDPFGAGGDFITAPEISQMFGELIGIWAAETWNLCGSPQPGRLVELGPGRGTLMADALRATRVSPEFAQAIQVDLVETSPALQNMQAQMLGGSGAPVAWHTHLQHVPHGPAIIIANELFDALPVRHYVMTERGWCERVVGLDNDGALMFGAGEREPHLRVEAAEGSIIEVGAQGHALMTQISERIIRDGGAALIIDYGHIETLLGETLQAVQRHEFVDPLADPGKTDLTAHVDFAALARTARAAGAFVHGPVPQGRFLRQLGIQRRAEALARRATPEQIGDIESACDRLTSEAYPSDMGALFKVMAITRPGVQILPGFFPEDAA